MHIYSFGPYDTRSYEQLDNCLNAAFAKGDSPIGVLCADHHPGYSMPIGGVLATKHLIAPAAVGFDIACGNMAVSTDIDVKDIDIAKVMNEIGKVISFGIGRNNSEKINDHPIFDAIANSPVKPQRKLLQLAKQQLGTVGSGNHYVDLFRDIHNKLWIGVHFGSRGFGHKTCTGFLAIAEGKQFDDHVSEGPMDSAPKFLSVNKDSGLDYFSAMQLAGDYAYAGREWVVNRVLAILGTQAIVRVHNHHNFAWYEKHNGEHYIVTRKGATPAQPNQLGFIGGSMLDIAVIVEGKQSQQAVDGLYSTVHGAGRVMSRTQAAGKVKRKTVWKCGQRDCSGYLPINTPKGYDGSNPKCNVCGSKTHKDQLIERKSAGLVDWPNWQKKLVEHNVVLIGAGPDEAPECYKPLGKVLSQHSESINILHTLFPIGVAMAGNDIYDPYKD